MLFTGKSRDWSEWSFVFEGYMYREELRKAMLNRKDRPTIDEDLEGDDLQAANILSKKNEILNKRPIIGVF